MAERRRCYICGMEHGPGNCAAFNHLADQVTHLQNRDDNLARRSAYATQLAFAVDDLLSNLSNKRFRDDAIKRLRRIRERFMNI